MGAYPIPAAALDDRLGWIGTSGSGKTYNAGGGVEALLRSKARVVIVDPLDVWWGLRLAADGKGPSPYPVVIFGGVHGDLPLTEHAGALIGETVAHMGESCIVSLGGLTTKAAERRFMLAFLDAIYRHADAAKSDPFHIVFDEADLWAPQKSSEPMLQSRMEEIVRRGRIKGFIPWLITQRPAVLSKDVLSQVDGLIAFKLTSSQDRDAIGGWIEGQADRVQGKEILASLPTMQQGQGVVWVPGRGVLDTVAFPPKETFDSSRTPKRGERRKPGAELRPLDLSALKDKLANVEAETKANDPKALKAEIARLSKALASKPVAAVESVTVHDPDAERRGYERGLAEGETRGVSLGLQRAREALAEITSEDVAPRLVVHLPTPARHTRPAAPAPSVPVGEVSPESGDLSGPQRVFLSALAWWAAMGHAAPSKAQVAAIAGWRVTSGHIKNVAGGLRTKGLIDYPAPGNIGLTETGRAAAPEPDMATEFHDRLRGTLTGPQRVVLDYLLTIGASSREELARGCGWEPTSGHVKNVLGSLSTLEIVTYPERGMVALQDWVLP